MVYALSVSFRYIAMALQFIVVILLARRLTQNDAGMYFQIFGLVTTTYFLFGLGFPDGIVKYIAEANIKKQFGGLRTILLKSLAITILTALFFTIIIFFIFEDKVNNWLIVLTCLWWAAYGIVFFSSQILVAAERPMLGAFFFYPLINIALFLTSVPYLIFSTSPTLEHTLELTVFGASLCAMIAAGFALSVYKTFPKIPGQITLKHVLKLGIQISVSRVLQTAIYWLPVWGAGYYYSSASAASMGTASRLNIAVAAVMAAIRFTARPGIAQNAVAGNWQVIKENSTKVATLATLVTVAAIIGNVLLGPLIISLIFGEAYRSASYLLTVFLIGTLAECIGGTVDEVLKMTGYAQIVLITLLIAVPLEALLIFTVSDQNEMMTAASQSIIFTGIYCFMLSFLSWKKGIYVGARLHPRYLFEIIGLKKRAKT